MDDTKPSPRCTTHEASMVLDAAFGQEVITVNEFRQLLGLGPIRSGDVTVRGRSIEQAWLEKQGLAK